MSLPRAVSLLSVVGVLSVTSVLSAQSAPVDVESDRRFDTSIWAGEVEVLSPDVYRLHLVEFFRQAPPWYEQEIRHDWDTRVYLDYVVDCGGHAVLAEYTTSLQQLEIRDRALLRRWVPPRTTSTGIRLRPESLGQEGSRRARDQVDAICALIANRRLRQVPRLSEVRPADLVPRTNRGAAPRLNTQGHVTISMGELAGFVLAWNAALTSRSEAAVAALLHPSEVRASGGGSGGEWEIVARTPEKRREIARRWAQATSAVLNGWTGFTLEPQSTSGGTTAETRYRVHIPGAPTSSLTLVRSRGRLWVTDGHEIY